MSAVDFAGNNQRFLISAFGDVGRTDVFPVGLPVVFCCLRRPYGQKINQRKYFPNMVY